MRGIWIGGMLAVAMLAGIAACISDEPATGSASSGGPVNDGAASSSSGSGSSSSSSSGVPSKCPEADTTPNNCGTDKEYCFGTDASPGCAPVGFGTNEGCADRGTLRCTATTCIGGEICCYKGSVRNSPGPCAKSLTAFDTACEPVGAKGACVVNDERSTILCATSEDCAPHDAGTCVFALMDAPINRVFGVCTKP